MARKPAAPKITAPDVQFSASDQGGHNTLMLTVNGRSHTLEVQPNWTLWYVLRDKLGITSPKDMCNGYGACGSCTVIVNGRPVLSCMTLAMDCRGATIETAEGIADAKHPLVEAYVELYAMQCGYCTPGFLVTAKALLDRNPRPTEADIRDALGGNLCKCSSYPSHIRAVLIAAQELWEIKTKKLLPAGGPTIAARVSKKETLNGG